MSSGWVAVATATLLFASGCFTGPGSQDGDPNQTTAAGGPGVLPGNMSLAKGELLQRDPHQVTWRWTDTLDLGLHTLTGDEPPQATTRLEVPPDLWLRVTVTLSYESQGTDLDLAITHGELSLCQWDTIDGERVLEPALEVLEEDRETCEVRPDPTADWRSWSLSVIAEHWDPRAPQQNSFEVSVSVQALESAWSDIAPSRFPEAGWPRLDEAPIRPGTDIREDQGCTANFVFQSPTNASLYIGAAAHCIDGWEIGTLLGIAGYADAGRLAYCSWGTLETDTDTTAGCPMPEESLDERLDNDFALLEIRPDLRHLVHPALLHWGGPTGLAEEVNPGLRVLMYGNSYFRDGFQSDVPGPADPMEGYVVHPGYNEYETYLTLDGGFPGDSGSPVITETGLALGVLRSLEICEENRPWHTVVDVAPALAFIHDRTDLELQLSTWPLIEENLLPADLVQQELRCAADG